MVTLDDVGQFAQLSQIGLRGILVSHVGIVVVLVPIRAGRTVHVVLDEHDFDTIVTARSIHDKVAFNCGLEFGLRLISPFCLHVEVNDCQLGHQVVNQVLHAEAVELIAVIGIYIIVSLNKCAGEALHGAGVLIHDCHRVFVVVGDANEVIAIGLGKQLHSHQTTGAPSAPGTGVLLNENAVNGHKVHDVHHARVGGFHILVVSVIGLGDSDCQGIVAGFGNGRQLNRDIAAAAPMVSLNVAVQRGGVGDTIDLVSVFARCERRGAMVVQRCVHIDGRILLGEDVGGQNNGCCILLLTF